MKRNSGKYEMIYLTMRFISEVISIKNRYELKINLSQTFTYHNKENVKKLEL